METQSKNTNVRLTDKQYERLAELSSQLKISRNRVFGVLIESAKVESEPVVSVRPSQKTKSDDGSIVAFLA